MLDQGSSGATPSRDHPGQPSAGRNLGATVSVLDDTESSYVPVTVEKEKRLAGWLTSWIDWRPQGDSNPRYRRESRKSLKKANR